MSAEQSGRQMRGLKQAATAFAALGEAATTAAFGLLDIRLAVTPEEDRPTRSWDVEREEFIRKHTTDPRDDA